MLTDLQRIEHMIETADLLLRFSSNLTEAEYAASLEKQYAMKFAFVMLGEDAARISEEVQKKHPDIPWREIKGLRNIVAHAYNKTDGEVIWETASNDIEPSAETVAPDQVRTSGGYRETLRRLSFREEACGGMLTLHPLRRSGGRGRLRRHAHRHRLLQRLLHGERRDGEVGVESVGVVLTVRDEQRERGVAEIRRLESGEVRVVPPRLGVILWTCLSLERGNGRLREMKWKI